MLQVTQEGTTSTQFLDWQRYLNWKDTEEFNRQDHYFAQIAMEIRRGNVKPAEAGKLKVQDFLLEFKSKKINSKMTPEEEEERIQNSKNYWRALATAGMNQKKKKLPDKVRMNKE